MMQHIKTLTNEDLQVSVFQTGYKYLLLDYVKRNLIDTSIIPITNLEDSLFLHILHWHHKCHDFDWVMQWDYDPSLVFAEANPKSYPCYIWLGKAVPRSENQPKGMSYEKALQESEWFLKHGFKPTILTTQPRCLKL